MGLRKTEIVSATCDWCGAEMNPDVHQSMVVDRKSYITETTADLVISFSVRNYYGGGKTTILCRTCMREAAEKALRSLTQNENQ